MYTNTQRDHKAQRLVKQTEKGTQKCNTDRKTFFFFSGHQNHKDMTS